MNLLIDSSLFQCGFAQRAYHSFFDQILFALNHSVFVETLNLSMNQIIDFRFGHFGLFGAQYVRDCQEQCTAERVPCGG